MSFLIHVASNKDNNLYYLHYAEGLDTWCMYNQDLAAPFKPVHRHQYQLLWNLDSYVKN